MTEETKIISSNDSSNRDYFEISNLHLAIKKVYLEMKKINFGLFTNTVKRKVFSTRL